MYPRGTEFSGVQNGEMGDCTPKWGTFGNPETYILNQRKTPSFTIYNIRYLIGYPYFIFLYSNKRNWVFDSFHFEMANSRQPPVVPIPGNIVNLFGGYKPPKNSKFFVLL
jgi:hypothetical protein